MRRVLSIILIFAFLFSIATINVQSAERQKKGTASYGTPKVDGVMDDCYKNSSELAVEYIASIANSATEKDTPAKGKVWMCWDESALYLFVDVIDPTPITKPLDNFSSDAFESVFDFDNNKSYADNAYESYADNGLFVKVLAYAKTVGSPDFEIDWVLGMETDHQQWFASLPASEHQVACVITNYGYIIERRIPVNNAVKAMLKPGYSFGFQIWLLDDIDDNNQRDFKLSWGEPTNDVSVGTWVMSAVCDEITLIAAPPPPVVAEPEPMPEAPPQAVVEAVAAPVAVATPSIPQTGNIAFVLTLISLIGAGGLSVLTMKNRRKLQ